MVLGVRERPHTLDATPRATGGEVMLLRDAGFALMVALFPVAVVPLCIVAEWLTKMIRRR